MTQKLIKNYLKDLKKELKKTDLATIHDALSDAEEHLTTGLENLQNENPDIDEEKAFIETVEEYGTPSEIAEAYQQIEERVKPALMDRNGNMDKDFVSKFFGIIVDPKAWGALLYLLISFITGIVYFVWAIVGFSLSVAFAIFIFGLPFFIFFILSVRWIGLLEGRIVEPLLGVRMPRRLAYFPKEFKWRDKIKVVLSSRSTWTILLYMILQFALGIMYFSVIVVSISFSFAFLAAPILVGIWGAPFMESTGFFQGLPGGYLTLMFLAGLVIPPATLHLAKFAGRLHGKLAKLLLVSE